MAKVVVAGPANFVALAAVVVFIAAYADGVLEAGDQAFVLHRLLLLSGVDHPLVDAALDQQLIICTKDKRINTNMIDYCKKLWIFSISHSIISIKENIGCN